MKTAYRFALALLVAACLNGSAAATARGAVVFSNLDANESSDGSSTVIGGQASSFASRVAAPFTVAGGSSWLQSVAVVVDDRGDGRGALDIGIHADDAGKPGATLESFSYAGDLVRWKTVSSPFGDYQTTDGPLLVTVASQSPVWLADGGTYWISLTSAEPDTDVLWRNNSTGDARPSMIDRNFAGTWENLAFSDPAFRVTGAVPEPAAAALAAIGSLGLLARRRRR